MPLHPISFSIPEEHIVSAVPAKTRAIAYISPHDRSTYIYKDQASYYKGYQDSWFGSTMKKAGWDCMRHYEILANGCIPFFVDIKSCPASIMTTFPKQLVYKAMHIDPHLPHNHAKLTAIIEQLLAYTRQHLTTRATALYVLRTINAPVQPKVLMINGMALQPDYLRCLLAHGLRQELGSNFIEVPRLPHLYTDFPVDQLPSLYGMGFSYARLLDATADQQIDRTNIPERIKCKEFDYIIYGSVHRNQSLWDLVVANYPANRIIWLCGEDTHSCEFQQTDVPYHFFMRELNLRQKETRTKK
jgi:hypothetical protein